MKKRRRGKGTGLILALLLALLFGLLVLRVLKDKATPPPAAEPTEEPVATLPLPAEPEPEQQPAAPEEDEDELTDIEIETLEDALAAAQQTQAGPAVGEDKPVAPAVSTGGVGANETVEVPFVIYD